MLSSRRNFIRGVSAAAIAGALPQSYTQAQESNTELLTNQDGSIPDCAIVDTHQHLWNLNHISPPWLSEAGDVLRQDYESQQYAEATDGVNISAVYMEVDVAPNDHVREAETVLKLIESGDSATRAAVIGGRPADPQFDEYLRRFEGNRNIKGIRQVLHGSTPRGFCLEDNFVKGIRRLAKYDLMFDLCMRPAELADAEKLIGLAPDTHFVIDHCGNADFKSFAKNVTAPSHDPNRWKADMESIAKHPNVVCKISGIVAQATAGWKPADLAPVINHCLDTFGPDRVVFGSDWPVCLLGSPLKTWIRALSAILSTRPKDHQLALWSGNAMRIYRLNN